MSSKDFLYRYLNNPSPTGFEDSGQAIWLSYIKPYVDDYFCDTYGSLAAVINPKASYKVVIEAHADEIGWFVNYISPEGYLYIVRNGGSDHQIAPSMRVHVHTEKGDKVPGIFGWPAIHVRDKNKEESPSLKNLTLDIGASSQEEVQKMGVQVGCPVTFQDELTELNGRYWVGRGLDNRIGGYIIAEVARRLRTSKKKLDYALYIVNAVQEEVGLRGAEMISRNIAPHAAIVTDVFHDTQSPMYEKKTQGDFSCGKGPIITCAPAVQNNLRRFVVEVAKNNKIPIQLAAASRYTGTDTDAFAYSAKGVASALISLPLKYMHTTVEMVNKEDVEQVIALFQRVLEAFPTGSDFKYL